MKRYRYDRQGLLALEPRAFFDLFVEPVERENEAAGDAAVVAIRGPLESHRGWWCDSYDAIVERVHAACAGPAKAVVLRIDSPGGDVAGMLDAARSIRAACDAAGKRLLAYVDGKACSAAYALACVADSIVVDDAALVGSIGVISARVDATAQAAMYGVKVALITSGARKADGHPQAPITEAELAETQTIVDSLARPFFEHVAAHREIDAAAIVGLEARVFAGDDAVRAGLADRVGTFDQVLAMASADAAAEAAGKEKTMSKARKAMQAILDDKEASDEDKADAKKALAAMDESDDSNKKKEESKAEGGDEKKDEPEKKDEEAKAQTSSNLAAQVAAQGKILAELQAEQRAALLASRPDLPADLVKVLSKKPLAEVREIVANIPPPPPAKKPTKLGEAAAAATPAATRGEGQGEKGGPTPDPELAAVDRAMGFSTKTTAKVEMRGNVLYLGRAPDPAPDENIG